MYTKTQIQNLQNLTNTLLKSNGTVEELRDVLRFHEYRYYILNDPLISDSEYDQLYKKLEKIEKENPSLITKDSPTQRVGNSLNKDFVTVPHLVPMLSLENSYNPQDLIDWSERLNGLTDYQKIHFSAEPKFDGASISLIYENDLLVRGATRGDGAAGDDITTNIKQIGSIPLSAKFSEYGIEKIEIRGEVLLTKENFRKFNETLSEEGIAPLANPRNAAAGSLRMKDPSAVRKRKLEAILYHVSFIQLNEKGLKNYPQLLRTHSGTLQLLAELGFKTPIREKKIFTDINQVVNFCRDFENKRDELPYEIDGIVVKVNEIELQQQVGSTTHHPRWAIAYKFKARQATSKLINVEFQVGRTGSITPVAKIEPVPIGGVTVSSVSLFNEGIIQEKDLRLGDTVIVERAGDVIPYIVKPNTELRTGKETKIIFPVNCPVCGDPLVKTEDEAVWRCVNISCEAQVVERIIHYVSKDAMDIKTMGEANVRKFYAQGLITDIPSIYSIDHDKIASLEGFKQKSVDNLLTAIEHSKKQSLNRLIFGLGIRYVGETTAKILAKSIDTIFELKKFSIEELQQLKDIGTKVAESIFTFFHNEDNIIILEKLAEKGVNINGNKTESLSGKLSGYTFLFTGTLPALKRNEAEKLAEENGGKLLSSVSANLNYLVAGESAGSKLDKAKKIKTVKIINEEEFLNLIQS
ncbi:MAG: NAD-dependent DNA ligase LigA [Bacteroidota bacterium]|nr:NAD-dependent DNA ligase LigA [Bacteroidota bacterium]